MKNSLRPDKIRRWKDGLAFANSFLLWIIGGMALAAVASQWESISHADTRDFALSRIWMNLAIGGLSGLLIRLVRFINHGK